MKKWGILGFLAILAAVFLVAPVDTQATQLNGSFNHSTNFTIQNSNGANYSNLQVFVNLSVTAQMQADCSDVLWAWVNASNGQNQSISSWLFYNASGSQCWFWLNVPMVYDAGYNGGNTTVVAQYNSSYRIGAGSIFSVGLNGSDDFNDNLDDSVMWYINQSWGFGGVPSGLVCSAKVNIENNSEYRTMCTLSSSNGGDGLGMKNNISRFLDLSGGVAVHVQLKRTASSGNGIVGEHFGYRNGPNANLNVSTWMTQVSGTLRRFDDKDAQTSVATGAAHGPANFTIILNETSKYWYYRNATRLDSTTRGNARVNDTFWLGGFVDTGGQTYDVTYDDFFLRQCPENCTYRQAPLKTDPIAGTQEAFSSAVSDVNITVNATTVIVKENALARFDIIIHNNGTASATYTIKVNNSQSAATAILNDTSSPSIASGGIFKVNLNITDETTGIYNLQINASDSTNLRSVSVSVNVTQPGVNVTSNASSGVVLTNTNFTYLIRIHNNGTVQNTYNLSANASGGATATLNQSVITVTNGAIGTVILLVNHSISGSYGITVNATDREAALVFSQVVTNTTVHTTPRVDAISWSPSPAYARSTINCNATVVDDNPSFNVSWIILNGTNVYNSSIKTGVANNTNTIISSVVGLMKRGEVWDCRLNVTDMYSVTNSPINTTTINITNTAPYLVNSSVNQSTIRINDSLRFTAILQDDDAELLNGWLEWNLTGTSVNTTFVSQSGYLSNLTVNISAHAARGTVVGWRLFANDTRGLTNVTASASFTIANSAPIISIATLLNTSPQRGQNTTFNISVSDSDNPADLDVILLEWNVSGTAANVTVTDAQGNSTRALEFIQNVSNKKNTVVGWKIWVNDTTNQWTSSTLASFTVANTPIIINNTILAAYNFSYVNATQILEDFNFTDIDQADGVDTITWATNDTSYFIINSTGHLSKNSSFNTNTTSIERRWILNVSASDGTARSENISITVNIIDGVLPEIANFSLDETIPKEGDTVSIRANIWDNATSLASVLVEIVVVNAQLNSTHNATNYTMVNVSGGIAKSLTALVSILGEHRISIWASDVAGNIVKFANVGNFTVIAGSSSDGQSGRSGGGGGETITGSAVASLTNASNFTFSFVGSRGETEIALIANPGIRKTRNLLIVNKNESKANFDLICAPIIGISPGDICDYVSFAPDSEVSVEGKKELPIKLGFAYPENPLNKLEKEMKFSIIASNKATGEKIVLPITVVLRQPFDIKSFLLEKKHLFGKINLPMIVYIGVALTIVIGGISLVYAIKKRRS